MVVPVPDDTPVARLAAVYLPLVEFADALDDDTGWRPTALPGWCVRDLVFHLLADAQRALVALATPADGPADTDEVTYWSHWQPGTEDAMAGLRGTRIQASAWTSVRGPALLYTETARAVLVAASRADPDDVVSTQGRSLTVRSLLDTLVVEATIHQLDLEVGPPPTVDGLDRTRAVLDALLGRPSPADWDPARWARIGTGRIVPTREERDQLGELAIRLPLFG